VAVEMVAATNMTAVNMIFLILFLAGLKVIRSRKTVHQELSSQDFSEFLLFF
jgi:hypothetical protein